MSSSQLFKRFIKKAQQSGFSSKYLMTTLFALMSVPIALFYTSFAIANKPLATIKPNNKPPTQVSVVLAKPIQYHADITSHGEAKPHYQLDLQSEVNGRITEISPALSMGNNVSVSTQLIQVDSTNYQHTVASAEKALFEAELAVAQEQLEVQHTTSMVLSDKIATPNTEQLAYRKPQLAVIKAQVQEAKAQLLNAQKELKNTQITSPFNAIVVERKVELGQFLKVGDVIATLHSTDRVDIEIYLPIEQWQLLPSREELIGFDQVQLTSRQGSNWQGTITEISQHISSENRQRAITISVFDPLLKVTPLLAGTFLSVTIPVDIEKSVFVVPASSLTSDGTIWYVDNNNQLQKTTPEIAFQQQGKLYLELSNLTQLTKYSSTLTVLTRPMPSYSVGQKVNTKATIASALVGVGS